MNVSQIKASLKAQQKRAAQCLRREVNDLKHYHGWKHPRVVVGPLDAVSLRGDDGERVGDPDWFDLNDRPAERLRTLRAWALRDGADTLVLQGQVWIRDMFGSAEEGTDLEVLVRIPLR